MREFWPYLASGRMLAYGGKGWDLTREEGFLDQTVGEGGVDACEVVVSQFNKFPAVIEFAFWIVVGF